MRILRKLFVNPIKRVTCKHDYKFRSAGAIDPNEYLECIDCGKEEWDLMKVYDFLSKCNHTYNSKPTDITETCIYCEQVRWNPEYRRLRDKEFLDLLNHNR